MNGASRLRADLLGALAERVEACALIDRPALARELARLRGHPGGGRALERRVEQLVARIDASVARVERRRRLVPVIRYDTELPIVAHRPEIRRALEQHSVIVVCGATGSGKTTQLPKICLEAGRGLAGLIGHTQPRRIAARAIAERVASEMGGRVGDLVGYQVRFTDHTGPSCRLKLMTDGILLRELERDRQLRRYDTLIIDEAHERSLNVDFLLGVLKRLVHERPELRLIITSATIDPQSFATFFAGAPVIEVSGRSYPVELRYRPLSGDGEQDELSLAEGVVAAVAELDAAGVGARDDILVFLPGERQIRETAQALEQARLGGTEVLPLYARLSASEQARVFEPHALRRIVLATNVAETSLTVPGIRYVIDSGLARISRYSTRNKVQRLPIEPVSRASAEQRRGRCGREGPGICIRLYAEEDFETRPEYSEPEILRTSLASVILRMTALGLGDPIAFPFLDAPETRLVNDGYRLLEELEAVDSERRITALGCQIAALPVDPRLARMLIAASRRACLREMLTVAAFLTVQDPRDRPADAQAQADEAHGRYADRRSDFLAVLNLWAAYREAAQSRSGSQLRRWCRTNFLSYPRLRDWQDVQEQLRDALEELEMRPGTNVASYADLHEAILSGFLGQVGAREERRDYRGTRGLRFTIAPGSPLAARPPRWIVAGSIIETGRPYARMVAAVEPRWIERVAGHLVKRAYSEAHWVADRGYVAAFESVSLFGLTLTALRAINFAAVDPAQAREIFVREALVEGDTGFTAPFLEANRRLRRRIEGIEARIRRRDVLVDARELCDFYLARLPADVNSVATLERWLPRATATDPRLLVMSEADLMRREVPATILAGFPDRLELGPNRLPLAYHFEPGAEHDGVTLRVPEILIDDLDALVLEWLVPGLLLEKLTALLRALPKEHRRQLVPIPERARVCLREIERGGSFMATVAQWLSRRLGASISAEQLRKLSLPDYLKMNIQVIDFDNKVLLSGRDLQVLRRQLRARRREPGRAPVELAAMEIHRAWDFGELPDERERDHGGVVLRVYPAIVPVDDGVALRETRSLAEAQAAIRRGSMKLAAIALPQQVKYARECFRGDWEFMLLASRVGGSARIVEALVERLMQVLVAPDGEPVPRSAQEFAGRVDAARARFGEAVDMLQAQTLEILRSLHEVRTRLDALDGPVFDGARAQIQRQLATLLPADFPIQVPEPWFGHLPRYLAAVARRIDRLRGNVARDCELAARIAPFERTLDSLRTRALEAGRPNAALDHFGWMLEEFRVSLFAQDLRTAVPVSEERLQAQLARARRELNEF